MKNFIKNGIFAFFALGLVLSFGQSAQAQTLYTTTTNSTPSSYGAVLHGSVNPDGYTTTVWFEYSTYPDLGFANQTPHEIIGSAPYQVPYSYSIQGLQPSTTYYFRLVANNGYETMKGNISSFMTAYQAPVNTQQYYYPAVTQYYQAPVVVQQTPRVINTAGTTEYVHNTKYIVTDTKYIQNTSNGNNTTVSTNNATVSTNSTLGANPYASSTVSANTANYNANAANSLFGASFLPNTFYGWLLLLILIFLIIWVARKIATVQ